MTTDPPRPSPGLALLQSGFGAVLGVLAGMWLIEIVDTVILDEALQRQGILPRTLTGLDGVLWGPFLHVDFGHLASNSVPFLVLGGLIVATRNVRTWILVTAIVGVLGGLGTWLFARQRLHVGASILIFGYITFLVVSAVLNRSVGGLLVAVVVLLVYGWTLLFGVLPIRGGVSWEGHLFGAAAGVVAAMLLAKGRGESPDDASVRA